MVKLSSGTFACSVGLPWWLRGKEAACNARDSGDGGSVPRLGRSPGGGHGNPHQCSCLDNLHGQRSLMAAVHRVTKSQTRLMQLSTLACTPTVWLEAHQANHTYSLEPRSFPGGKSLQYSCLENSIDRGAWRVQSMGMHRVRHD